MNSNTLLSQMSGVSLIGRRQSPLRPSTVPNSTQVRFD